MLDKIDVEVRGTVPLLMHSPAGINPFHPLSREASKYSGKRKKTDEDIIELLRIKWLQGLYYDNSVGVYLPADYFQAAMRDAAKSKRKGKDVGKGIFIEPAMIKLIYDGPQDIKDLVNDERFRDVRVGRIQNKGVQICRPRFNQWKAKFSVLFDPKIWNKTDVLDVLSLAGQYLGVGDYRPRYGRFEVTNHE